MLKYVLKRLGAAVVTLIIASSILFFLVQLLPDTPYSSNKLDEAQKEAIMDELDVDEPLHLRYAQFVIGLIGFESDIEDGEFVEINYKVLPQFGNSWVGTKEPINEKIAGALPISMSIGIAAIIFGTIVGVTFGVIAGLYKNKFPDTALTFLAVLGISVPSFIFAMVLVYIFSEYIPILPVSYEIAEPIKSSILPSLALSTFVIATLTRYMRSELVEVFGSDYILLAKAKGIKHKNVIFRHSIRNALIPVVTVIGPLFLSLLAGSMTVESTFGIPGMGALVVDAVNAGDHPTVLGLSFYYSFFYIIVILLVDISYGLIDPRIRIAGGES